MALLVAVPLLQLVPLPPAVWMKLSGRSFAAEIASSVTPGAWYPLSLDAPATWQWLVALSVPVAAFLLARGTSCDQGLPVLWTIILIGCLSGLLGLLQLAAGGLHLYVSAHNNFPVGLFANRNHQATMMAITASVTLLLAVRRIRDHPGSDLLWPYMPILFLAATVCLLTQSRAGVALLALGIIPALLMLRRTVPKSIALAGLAGIVLAGVWLLFTGSGQGVFARLSRAGGDERFVSWEGVWFMATHHFPYGTGLGSFVRAFSPVESLNTVSRNYLNHAHCDYLELIAEAGIVGVLAIAAALVFVVLAVRRVAALSATQDRAFVEVAAVTVLVLLLLHSLVDYPARTFAIAAIAGAMAGLLTRPSGDEVGVEMCRLPGFVRFAVPALVLVAAAQVVRLTLGAIVAAAGGTVALPASMLLGSDAMALTARAELAAGHPATAERSAVAALRASTYNATALQTLGEIFGARGDEVGAYRLLSLAARATWRNSDVQWWALRQSLRDNNPQGAVDAGDALLRRGRYTPQVLSVFVAMAANGPARAVLAQRVAQYPPWSDTLLRTMARPDLNRTSNTLTLLADAMARGYRPNDALPQTFLTAALEQGYGDAVLALVRTANPKVALDPREGPVDGDFSRIAANRISWGPIGWRFGDRTAYFDDVYGGPGQRLHVGRTAGGDVLTQRLLLKAGTYTLRFVGGMSDPSGGEARWTIGCRTTSAKLVQATIGRMPDSVVSVRFTVPQQCPVQVLTLEVLPSSNDAIADLRDMTINN
ncbi:O-antigen ligase family protein [Sphingomonas faeni]|uniref:O-antigen ligase family protein n=1 Tax=Sphingomonas faeni TaxID=185950 RepID=UPI002786594B|nr:O-antigen ligase family protein [Sphingomonas faeni]MDQ0838837.1 O-antigen ligase [Sphingomonas faeni]